MKKKLKLEPPDMTQCQAILPGKSFMTFGGTIDPKRCSNKPKWIAAETVPGKDGLLGSMSLCENCRKAFVTQKGPGYTMRYKLSAISKT